MGRREFQMSQDDLDRIISASRPVPYLVVGGVGPRSPQENANTAWQGLGKKLGFVWDSVEPIPGKSQHFFTAVGTSSDSAEGE